MGERFRSAYSELDSLRSLVPAGVPVLAMSATFTPVGLETASKVLEIDLKKAFYLNIGISERSVSASQDHTRKLRTRAKLRIMLQFRNGKRRVLVATEAAAIIIRNVTDVCEGCRFSPHR